LVGHKSNDTARQIVTAARKPALKQEGFEEEGKPEATRTRLVREEDVLFLRKGPMLCKFVRMPIAFHAIPGGGSCENGSLPVGHRMFSDGLEAIGIDRKSFHPTRQLLARWLSIDSCGFERLMA
jgi:hypothetical protein